MATVPRTARVVVIGAGIVGNSLVHHLARLGWRDIVQIDKGPLPNPGGSTGHASNFIFPVDHSRELTDLTLDSMRQYKEIGVFTESGGFEIARTEERMEELRRRMSSAKAWGIEAELVTPDLVVGKVPVPGEGPDPRRLLDAVGRRRRLAAGRHDHARGRDGDRRAHRRAERRGARHGRRDRAAIRRVRTDKGDIEAEYVVIAVRRVEPEDREDGRRGHPAHPRRAPDDQRRARCPQLAERPGEISFPIVRDMDTFCYERQHGADMEVGSYAHRAILHEPEEIPSIEQAKLSPTEMPFTSDDFDPQLEQALRADARRCSAPTARRSATRSTGCCRSPRTARRSSARRPRSRACGRRPPSGSRRDPASAARSRSG